MAWNYLEKPQINPNTRAGLMSIWERELRSNTSHHIITAGGWIKLSIISNKQKGYAVVTSGRNVKEVSSNV
jgi:hypothetical protein